MTWTLEQKLRELMRLPWTVRVERDADGFVARVDELPALIATGEDEKSLARDLWDGLHTHIAAALEYGDPLVVPPGAVLPWETGQAPPAPRAAAVGSLRGDAWEGVTFASGSLATV